MAPIESVSLRNSVMVVANLQVGDGSILPNAEGRIQRSIVTSHRGTGPWDNAAARGGSSVG